MNCAIIVKVQSRQMVKSKNHHKRIIAIGGGKGGIGKSFIASNIALSLVSHNKRVVIVNLDLGSSNVSTILGVRANNINISDFITGKVHDINKVVIKTPYKHLGIIKGSSGHYKIADLKYLYKNRIVKELRNIDADYVLVDLGGGFSLNTLDFFNCADEKILIFTPDPTSIKDVYSFIKCAIYRKIARTFCNHAEANFIIDASTTLNSDGIARRMNDLISNLYDLDSAFCNIAVNMLSRYRPKLILNNVTEEEDLSCVNKVQGACKKFLNIEPEMFGHLRFDNKVRMSIRKMKPIIINHPFCAVTKSINEISRRLVHEETNIARVNSMVKESNGLNRYYFNMNTRKYHEMIKKVPIYSSTISDVMCPECGEKHFYLPYQYNTGLISCKACGHHMQIRDIFYSLNERSKDIIISNDSMREMIENDQFVIN